MADTALSGVTPAQPTTSEIAAAIRAAKLRRGKRAAVLKHVFLIITSLVMIYPLIWMLASSLKPDNQIFGDLGLWPSEFRWDNYTNGWNAMAVSFGRFFWNSTFVTMLSVIGNVISCSFAAYAFARLEFPGRNILFFSFLAGHAFPKFGLLVAIAGIFLQLNLIGTFWGVVLIQLIGTLLFMIWIPVAAFQSVDRRMEEAARDVGASPLRVFWSITLPQAGPTIAAAILLSFVGTFYETEGAWLIGAPAIRTMPVLMISFINNQPVIQYGAVLSVLLWIPSFVAILFARRVISSGSFARGFGA